MHNRTLASAFIVSTFLISGCNQAAQSPIAPSNAPGSGGTQWTAGTGGCTPGYWKQEQHFDSWPTFTGDEAQFSLTPDMTLTEAFGLLDRWDSDNITLFEALNLEGGGLNALLRHMVAALLNATIEIYPITWESLREMIYAAHAANTPKAIEDLKNILERNNERRCPLN
jgi:hypothetical protein